jgi:large subunit ribosomal protein L31
LPGVGPPPYIPPLTHQITANIEDRAVKPGIHPKYQRSTVVCACGNQFVTRSTTPEIHIEICARCHPYFTGKQKLIDTAGRVERFRQKYGREKVSG